MVELLGYIAAVLILGFALILFHNVLFEEDENKSGLSVDLTGVAIFLIMHAVVAALTSATFALIGSAVVILGTQLGAPSTRRSTRPRPPRRPSRMTRSRSTTSTRSRFVSR